MKPKGWGGGGEGNHIAGKAISAFAVRQTNGGEQKPLCLRGSCTLLALAVTQLGCVGISKGHLKGRDQQPALKNPTPGLKHADDRLLWSLSLC